MPNTSRESSAALFLAHQDGEVQRELDELKEYRQRALTMKGAGAKPPTLMETLARVLPLEHHTSQQLSSAEGTGAADSEASAEVALGEEAPAHLAAQVEIFRFLVRILNTSSLFFSGCVPPKIIHRLLTSSM